MAKTTGLGDAYFVGGYDLSGDTNSLGKISGSVALIDVTSIDQSAYQRVPGLRDGGIDWVSYLDVQPGQAHAALSPLPLSDVVCSYFRGTAAGNPAASIVAKQINYDPTRANNGAVTIAVATQANGFGLEWGLQVTPGKMTAANSLTGDASTFEGGISTWVAKTNCSIAQSSAQAHGGTKSLALTSTASGTMTAEHVTDSPNGAGGIAVTGGASYTVAGWFRSAVSARTCDMKVTWYDSTGTSISTTTGSTITDSTSAWTQASSVHLAPATAVFAIVLAEVVSTGGASEVHYVDDVLLVTASTPVIDNGASSTFGGQAYLQVLAFTGTDATVTLQDSPDNTTFTNLTNGAFTQITTASTTQRIATANNATINRYVRAAVTTSGGFTSLQLALQFTRNPLAGQVF